MMKHNTKIDAMLQEAIQKIKALGIYPSEHIYPYVELATNNPRYFGRCSRKGGMYYIKLSNILLEAENKKEAVETTLLHEVLHTCNNCMNHGKEWKFYADAVGRKYGYNISRVSSAESYGIKVEDITTINYILECQKCGKKHTTQRMSKSIKNPERYRCKCGGSLKRIK